MLNAQQVEDLILLIADMDRPSLIHQLKCYRANFPLDFTPDFLRGLSEDRLRHILMAVCLQCQRMPDNTTPVAA